MARTWTFGQKISGGFALAVALTFIMGIAAIYALNSVVASKDRVLTVDAQLLIQSEKLNAAGSARAGAIRGYLIWKEDRFLEDWKESSREFHEALGTLRRLAYTPEGRGLLDAITAAEAEYNQAADRMFAFRQANTSVEASSRFLGENVLPKRMALRKHIHDFSEREARLLEEARQAASSTATRAILLLVLMLAGCSVVFSLLALWLTRILKRQIGSAVGQVQTASSELQATASQQATGAREQATAMNEITTTISELLATSRQIAESAQQVAQIADQTALSARAGDTTVGRAGDSMQSIRRQVDLLVTHMLELGKKSQQIGAVLEIVSELAEQTNILAINATIEAAGAGEGGKRFAVVADEIRKLADRVGTSTKEIRALIEDVRGAVNTTVMVTESGSKAVDSGSHQFLEVAATFKQISSLIATTTEAAREIELSTKQQTSAVEQVNVAIADVMQATRETEASTGQTLQTASVLAGLSSDLLRLVQPKA